MIKSKLGRHFRTTRMIRNMDVFVSSILAILLFLCCITSGHSVLNTSSRYHSSLSHAGECAALLQFSDSFIASESYCMTNPKTASWKEDADCCKWDGVTCHKESNSVIGLDLSNSCLHGPFNSNSTLFSLHNLQRLDLSGNNFLGSWISSRFGVFSRMTDLNLSYAAFSGPIPQEIFHLSSLVKLYISSSEYGSLYMTTENHGSSMDIRLFSNLTKLRELYLENIEMSRISLPLQFTNLSSTLNLLGLSGCNLTGIFPMEVFCLPKLSELYVSDNPYLEGTLPHANWTTPLVSLHIVRTMFHGPIPASIGNLPFLNDLVLSFNEFSGSIPPALGNLESLTSLLLLGNNLCGALDFKILENIKNLEYLIIDANISVLLQNSGNCSFPKLQWLKLSNSNLTEIPFFLSYSTEITFLSLAGNNIQEEFPEWFWRPWRNTLRYLDLSYNNLSGEIPPSVCLLSALHILSLSNNSFRGSIPSCFENLRNLSSLLLDRNIMQGALPRSLSNCTSLSYLDLQSNMFDGVVSDIPLPPQLMALILADNHFEGSIPTPPPASRIYIISNNKFTGGIPDQFCSSASNIQVLDISNNILTGSIPRCSINSSLYAINLRGNKFVGEIPDTFVPGNKLRTIQFGRNQLGGMLPRSLAHCENLEALDLSENVLEDHFPYWLATLPNLQILDLTSNMFFGPVHTSNASDHPFPKLRIFDLSNNMFSGPLPVKYISNFIAMKNANGSSLRYMHEGSEYYQISISVDIKGMEIELEKILIVFTTIDLSRNFFEGEIPEEIGDQMALKGLNFSHNNLIGNIPSSVGNLTNLEWLDLSSNNLSGHIPRGLADLSWLSSLNLSNNQLMGQIPRSTQFDTFTDSFDGNPGLCGFPLRKPCGPDVYRSPDLSSADEAADSSYRIEWWTVAMGCVCGLVIGISSGYIMLETGKPGWLVRFVDGLIEGINERMQWRKTSKLKSGK